MVKTRKSISIDEEVWELAKIKISEPLSCYIQKQLEIACNLSNDKLEIERTLYEKEQEIIALRSQLIKIEREEKLKREVNYDLEKCMPTLVRIHNKCNLIGENQICRVASAHSINCNDLIKFCQLKGFNIVPLFEFNRESSNSNGSSLR